MKKILCLAAFSLLSAVAAATESDLVRLQAGAFKNPLLADSQAAKVSLLGVPATVVERKDADGNIVRVVRSSHRMPQKEAEALIDRLGRHNVNAVLLDSD